jgi:putative flavoprotein involved in K+ transport
MSSNGSSFQRAERVQTVVIGGGQAGLSVGYHLARRGVSFVILDASARIGDAWRHRWDSLRLFTPAQFDGLDGLPFPAPKYSFPTKNEMADYLEVYAKHFKLPVRSGATVDRLSRVGRTYIVSTSTGQQFEADHVVVAMASYQKPKVPAFARELREDIVQLHSLDYRNPTQMRPGDVLLVGAANSGAEIAIELVRHGHRVLMAGREVGEVPFRIGNRRTQAMVLPFLFRVFFHRIMTVKTPMGRKARASMLHKGLLLIRVKSGDLAAAGVERLPRLAGARDGLPLLDDGRVLNVPNVIWCTGFHPGFSWIDLPVFDADGEPKHQSGIVPGEPGLYFVGLHFLHEMSSTMIHGVGRDAARIAGTVAERLRAEATAPTAQAVAAVS